MIDFDKLEIDKSLRPYQNEVKRKVYTEWGAYNSIMLQMPTGTGKTRVFSSIVKDIHKESIRLKKALKVLILVHRRELIEQASETLGLKYNLAHGIILSRFFEQKKMPTQIASVQTLARRISNWKEKSFDYIIIDEAHHSLAPTYKSIIDLYSSAKVLGVTATPYRLNGASFKTIFDKLITSYSVFEFIEKGYLSNYKYYSIPCESYLNHKIRNINEFDISGDYSNKAMYEILDNKRVRADIINAYQKHAKGKKGIVYTINKKHNLQIAHMYNSIGVKAKCIDSNTKPEERTQIIDEFKNGDLEVLCNVNIFSEGFDCPDIEFIQLARPTKSLSLFLQQVGRGLRPHKDIEKVIFLDNVGSHNQFGLPSNQHNWHSYFSGKESTLTSSTQAIPSSSSLLTLNTEIEHGDEEVELLQETEKSDSLDFDEITGFPIFVINYDSFNSFTMFKIFDFKSILEQIMNDLDIIDEVDQDEFKFPTDEIEEFYEDVKYYNSFIKVRNENLHGIININKEVILPIEYNEIQLPNGYGFSICKKQGREGLIDVINKLIIIPFEYDSIQNAFYTGNLKNFIVSKNSKDGIYNLDLGLVLDTVFDEIIVEKNHYCVRNDSKWKIYNEDFQLVEAFESIQEVKDSDDHCIVSYNGFYGLWDTVSGDLVLPISYSSFTFKYGYIIASYKTYGIISIEYFLLMDEFFDSIIPPHYTKMSFWDKSKLLCYGSTKDSTDSSISGYGIIDINGNSIITTKYESIEKYKDKLLVRKSLFWQIIDWEENIICSSNKKSITKERYASLSPKNLPNIINLSHKVSTDSESTTFKVYNANELSIGQHIKHKKLGKGEIKEIYKSKKGNDCFAVKFEKHGIMKLTIALSPIKPVDASM